MNDSPEVLKLGITHLLESERGILDGARVGLIANSASTNEHGTAAAAALLNAGISLQCLFSPEHGYDAASEAGAKLSDSIDPATGLPVYSLYGETRQPTANMVSDLDAIVFDMQDVGVRCYTYIWTMALAMQSAALFGKLFVVLDRPNPLGGIHVQGPVLDPRFASFLGMYPIPLQYGMTIGELALLFNQSFEIGADLAVIRMQGWRRQLLFSDLRLPWRPPSPAIRSPETAFLYAGTCLFEGTNISEGRGTSSPFGLIGAPWLNPDIVKEIGARWLEGFSLSPRKFTPERSKYASEECAGLAISVVDRRKADPILLSVALLATIALHHRSEFEWNEEHFDAVAGTDSLRREIIAGTDPEEIFGSWRAPHREFEATRSRYLLYEG